MTAPLVLALLGDAATGAALSAGFEEEGVPVTVRRAHGPAERLAREAAGQSLLGIGIGGDGRQLALVLSASAGRPYIVAPTADSRALGHNAARIAARRPLRLG